MEPSTVTADAPEYVEAPVPDGPYSGLLNPDGTYTDNWTKQLPEDMQEYASTAKRFHSLPATIQAYAHAQRELNKFQQSSVIVPGEDADERTLRSYRERVGAPPEAAGYGLQEPPEGVELWDPEFGQKVNAVLHKHHVPAAAAQELAELEVERIRMYQEDLRQDSEDRQHQTESHLRAHWGDEYPQRRQEAEHVARMFGINPLNPDVATVLQAFQKLASYIREDETLQRQTGISADALNSLGIEGGSNQAMDIVRNPNNAWHDAYHGRQGTQRQQEARRHFHALAQQGG